LNAAAISGAQALADAEKETGKILEENSRKNFVLRSEQASNLRLYGLRSKTEDVSSTASIAKARRSERGDQIAASLLSEKDPKKRAALIAEQTQLDLVGKTGAETSLELSAAKDEQSRAMADAAKSADKATKDGNAATLEAFTGIVTTQEATTQKMVDLQVRIKTLEQQLKNSTRL